MAAISTSSPEQPIKFLANSGRVDFEFWKALSDLKVNSWKLDDTPREIVGYLSAQSVHTGDTTAIIPTVEVRKSSLAAYLDGDAKDTSTSASASWEASLGGTLYLYNTAEDFKNADKNAILNSEARKIYQSMQDNTQPLSVAASNRFVLLVFADLKTHSYVFWFGFPCVFMLDRTSGKAVEPFNLIRLHSEGEGATGSVTTGSDVSVVKDVDRMAAWLKRHITPDGTLEVGAVTEVVEAGERASDHPPEYISADFGSNGNTLIWGHRQLLFNLALKGVRDVLLHLIRCSSTRDICNAIKNGDDAALKAVLHSPETIHYLPIRVRIEPIAEDIDVTNVVAVGWEHNNKGQLAPRVANLRSAFDVNYLADSASNLNLTLMRWRMLPSLDVDLLAKQKVLLLGAGTLGCHVARDLLAWGIKHITLVDNGRVSFSNPVRQPLFEFKDASSVPGGRYKAEAAAAALVRIHPTVVAGHHLFTIPMPGHPVAASQREAFDGSISLLSSLIDEHDVVFLLTDTRESRWLPTVLCAQKRKLAVTIALGFDTFLVMRHGLPSTSDAGDKLGCYFCTDVVAPKDSTQNRTLDQQCTVTRPGLAPVASALGVELYVSLLHHPAGGAAPAEGPAPITATTASPIGLLPHQLRFFLTHYHPLIVSSNAFDKCPACSAKIIDAYSCAGTDFVAKCADDASYLESLSGLMELHGTVEDLGTEWLDEEDDGALL